MDNSQKIFFPDSILNLMLEYNNIENLDNLEFRACLENLSLSGNPICRSNFLLKNICVNCGDWSKK